MTKLLSPIILKHVVGTQIFQKAQKTSKLFAVIHTSMVLWQRLATDPVPPGGSWNSGNSPPLRIYELKAIHTPLVLISFQPLSYDSHSNTFVLPFLGSISINLSFGQANPSFQLYKGIFPLFHSILPFLRRFLILFVTKTSFNQFLYYFFFLRSTFPQNPENTKNRTNVTRVAWRVFITAGQLNQKPRKTWTARK